MSLPSAYESAASPAKGSGDSTSRIASRSEARAGWGSERLGSVLRSPLGGVSDRDWSLFVGFVSGGRKTLGEKSPANCLGMFNVSYLRLRDLKLASAKQVWREGKLIWVGEFRGTMTEEKFLSDPQAQYAVFVLDMRDRFRLVQKYVGRSIDGIKASASGLMAAAKLAGTKGFESWVNSPGERARFAATTEAFRALNGIF